LKRSGKLAPKSTWKSRMDSERPSQSLQLDSFMS
jgi:hypothetical protein